MILATLSVMANLSLVPIQTKSTLPAPLVITLLKTNWKKGHSVPKEVSKVTDKWIDKLISSSYSKDIIYDSGDILKNYSSLPTSSTPGKGFVILDNKILDVTSYLVSATNIVLVANNMHSRAFAIDRMFLPLDLTTVLYLKLGQDITPYFDKGNLTSQPEIYRGCLLDLFQVGITDAGKVEECLRINPALWATMGLGLLYFLTKMNLANLSRLKWVQRSLFKSNPEVSMTGNSRIWPLTLLMIPCYAENADTIRDTLNSLARTNYEDSRKMLVFVCDGLAQSAQDTKETYICVLEALGCSATAQATSSHAYVSLGQHHRKINFAKVYSGFYETGRNRVPFMVIVKVGAPREVSVGRAPGNRGKRDSMVLVLGFLERCTNLASNRMTPLEYELFNQCYNVLGIDPRRFKYMLVTDADTQVQNDVVHKMVTRLERDRRMLAVSGHIRPANPEQNLITMLQIFPLYMTFFTGLAYEACLGNVLTINGGLVMYKLWTENSPSSTTLGGAFGGSMRGSRQQRFSKSQTTSQESIRSKWPKVSDEIQFENDDDDPFATLPRDTAVHRQSTAAGDSVSDRPSFITGRESQLSLSPNTSTRSCCIHPTVLRSFAAPQADTLHMKNVLLLGEDQYFSTVLLRSHPHHHLGFEPDAVGYATIPTNYWALQALQSRNIRASFHNQVEMTRAARHIGFAAWFLSVTKILDMIFSVPIIVYLYGVFVRCFMRRGSAYDIIAYSFCALFVLHIVYFVIRRQFKYVLWFILYCFLSVPLFAIWFPLVALWCSDYAETWYDVWPTLGGWRWCDRLHGCVDDDYSRRIEQRHHKKEPQQSDGSKEGKSEIHDTGHGNNIDNYSYNYNTNSHTSTDSSRWEQEDEDSVVRMQLNEYEVIEAQRAYERATEEAAALDAKFAGFTAFGQSQSLMKPTMEGIVDSGPRSPSPLAQTKDDSSSFRGTTSGYRSVVDLYGTIRTKRFGEKINPGDLDNDLLPRFRLADRRSTSSPTDSLATNPFADSHDNPFDDGYAISPATNTNNNNSSRSSTESPTSSSVYPLGEVLTYHQFHQPPTSSHQHRRQHYQQHKPSHSQSSYFSNRSSRSYDYYTNAPGMFIPMEENLSATPGNDEQNGPGVFGHYRSFSAESVIPTPTDRRSIVSHAPTTDSCLSFDPETTLESRGYRDMEEDEDGRSMAIHGRVGLKIPERTAAALTAAVYRQRQASHSNNKNDPGDIDGNQRRHPTQQHHHPHLRRSSSRSSIHHQRNTSDTSQHNLASFTELIQVEIRSYLSRADLDSTTRAQVKEHLATTLGDRTRAEALQDMINQCIEATTLELLAHQA